MRYDVFVGTIATITGHAEETVRLIINNMPVVLYHLKEGDTLRTPLGTFRATARKARMIVPPNGKTSVPVVNETAVKLRPGSRLRRREESQD
jgi:nucleoid DNA-binding protein